jgi:two-component system, NtrC family, sensor kinase
MPYLSLRRRFFNWPLRRKMILGFLAVIGIGGIVSLLLGTRLEHRTIVSLAQAKVRHDLSSAWMVYNDRLRSIGDAVRLSAAREFLRERLRKGRSDTAVALLDGIRRDFELDVLTLTDAAGRVILRSRRPLIAGDDQASDPFVRSALENKSKSGTVIVPREELLKEGSDLAERAYFNFIATPMAALRPGDHEDSGMMLKAASPVADGNGRVLGVLYGGLLLNRDYGIVDRVKEIVSRGERYNNQDVGSATIFQGDLRIATNVLDASGRRAVGTRVSREVEEAVLRQGGRWMDRAFVVRDWFITAYEPIRDVEGKTIGMLYVGILEKPYIDLRNRVMGTFTVMALLAVVGLLVLLSALAATITRPVRLLVDATERIAGGDLGHRLAVESKDEFGHLAASFNRMTENLRSAQDNLAQWGRTLEKRVEERTHELREMQDALVQSEKLASLGKMAAGVAHEVNNPLTSILINAHLLLERNPADSAVRESLTLIADETARCAQIVRGLLEFSRMTPSRTAPESINDIIERTAQLLEKQALVRNIAIIKNLGAALPPLELDKNKIQQVFSNLMINACEAMPEGGTLTVSSRASTDGRGIEIEFADTGVGIPKANLTKLFDPFFSTKSFGTGLGLAVSYGIIRRRGGTIDVHSDVGRGSVFTVKLPFQPEESSGLEEDQL